MQNSHNNPHKEHLNHGMVFAYKYATIEQRKKMSEIYLLPVIIIFYALGIIIYTKKVYSDNSKEI